MYLYENTFTHSATYLYTSGGLLPCKTQQPHWDHFRVKCPGQPEMKRDLNRRPSRHFTSWTTVARSAHSCVFVRLIDGPLVVALQVLTKDLVWQNRVLGVRTAASGAETSRLPSTQTVVCFFPKCLLVRASVIVCVLEADCVQFVLTISVCVELQLCGNESHPGWSDWRGSIRCYISACPIHRHHHGWRLLAFVLPCSWEVRPPEVGEIVAFSQLRRH